MVIVPCKDCKDRKVGCHSECDRYKQFTIENEKLKQYVKEQMPPTINKWSFHGYTDTTGKRRRHDGNFS